MGDVDQIQIEIQQATTPEEVHRVLGLIALLVDRLPGVREGKYARALTLSVAQDSVALYGGEITVRRGDHYEWDRADVTVGGLAVQASGPQYEMEVVRRVTR